MDPDVAFGVELGRLLDAVHACGFGEDVLEEAGGVEQLEGAAGVAFGEHEGEFVADALEADLVDLRGGVTDSCDGAGLDGEVEAGGETDGSEHAELVFGEAQGRVADGSEDLRGEVDAAAYVVERGRCGVAGCFVDGWVEQHAVDGEVAAEDIFAGVGGELDRVGAAAVAVGSVVAEGGDFG